MIQIGTKTLRPGAALAPMAGATDAAMRRLCVQYGASCTVSEMVSAKALTMGDRKSLQLMQGGEADAPFGIQLFGAQPDVMRQAAAMLAEGRYRVAFDFLDINMGCPAPKITGTGAGSALLKVPQLAAAVAEAVVQGAQGVPVTVKMRIGWDEDDVRAGHAVEIAKRCEQAGVAMLTVHGRTRRQMYEPGIRVQEIRRIQKAVTIPVLANGDVTSADGALQLIQETECAGVAVGRGAMGNPWLFAQIAAVLQGNKPPPPPGLAERFRVLRAHIYEMCEDKGERVAMMQARSHAAWYMHGLRGAAQLRRMCSEMLCFTDLDGVIDAAWDAQRTEQTREQADAAPLA